MYLALINVFVTRILTQPFKQLCALDRHTNLATLGLKWKLGLFIKKNVY